MNKPLVTIITPSYNCARYIKTTVRSVLDQSYENIKYIIIDDGSTDSTINILRDIPEIVVMDKRIQAFYSRGNIGEQATVNEALDMVYGKYFIILNADDLLILDAVEELARFMERNPAVLCAYPDWDSINEDGSFRSHIKSREYDFVYMVKHHTCLPSVGSIFRSDMLKTVGYRDISLPLTGDFDFWLKIGLAGKMAHIPATLALWRRREGQASGSKNDERAEEHIRVIEKFYSRPGIPFEILKVKREAKCWAYLVAAAVSQSRRQIIRRSFKGLMQYPQILLQAEFWHAAIIRANYILRR